MSGLGTHQNAPKACSGADGKSPVPMEIPTPTSATEDPSPWLQTHQECLSVLTDNPGAAFRTLHSTGGTLAALRMMQTVPNSQMSVAMREKFPAAL